MPKTLTISIAKLVFKSGRLFGMGGTALPGKIAEKIDPDILSKLTRGNFKGGIILITGTNGKTTAATLSASVLSDNDLTILHNKGGSNLVRGLISTLIKDCDWRGRVKAEIAVFEVDENALPEIVKQTKPTHIVVTNLFRDQLDRYGELDTTARKLKQAIDKSSAKLFLNADDPLVMNLSAGISKNRITYFGVDSSYETKLPDEFSADSTINPNTGEELIYDKRYYSHIGRYHSKDGLFKRPKPKICAEDEKIGQKSLQFKVNDTVFKSKLGGFYNLYNCLLAVSLGLDFGLELNQVQRSLKKTSPAFGRLETIRYGDTPIQLLLIKNPVGFNQVIENFLLKKSKNPLLIAINDNYADGRDVSWLWDSCLEALQSYRGPIIVSGQRASDMALRLKYANVENFTIINNLESALSELRRLAKSNEAFIVPTYTAMLGLRSYLAKKGKIKEYWQ